MSKNFRTALFLATLVPFSTGFHAAERRLVEVRMITSVDGAQVHFDPVGVHIRPGDTVRWIQVNGYHSVAAYHPANGHREPRIPDNAEPWDSDILLAQYPTQGSTFERRFTVEGVYDYFCQPHEAAGMVGRIVVGKPGNGPGTRPFNYAAEKGWRPVPAAAQAQFPSVEAITNKQVVRWTPRPSTHP
jgi:plastocyanin